MENGQKKPWCDIEKGVQGHPFAKNRQSQTKIVLTHTKGNFPSLFPKTNYKQQSRKNRSWDFIEPLNPSWDIFDIASNMANRQINKK